MRESRQRRPPRWVSRGLPTGRRVRARIGNSPSLNVDVVNAPLCPLPDPADDALRGVCDGSAGRQPWGVRVLQWRCRLTARAHRQRIGRQHQGGTGTPGGQHHHRWRWQRRRHAAAHPRAEVAQLPAGNVPLIKSLLQWLRPAPRPIDDALWDDACRRAAWLHGLDDERRARLRVLTTRFLHEKTITPIGDLQLQAGDGVLLAALCCLPLLEFGEVGLEGWSQLIVYPDAFRVHRSHMDAAGVLHEWDDELIGESWDSGPLILSWADVQADLAAPHEGYCVAVHEMVHKLDALDGAMDGTPPLPRAWQREWAATFQQAYDAFCVRVDAGEETLIDPYAAEAPEEFFAVTSEYHFSAPDLLQQALPEVAAQLRRFYGKPPAIETR